MTVYTAGIIVYANSRAEAREAATSMLADMAEANNWLVRYELTDTAYDATSRAGQGAIRVRMEYMHAAFNHAVGQLNELLATDPQTLWDTDDNGVLRWWCSRLDDCHGRGIWLYTYEGEPVSSPNGLRDVLNKYEEIYTQRGLPNPHKDQDVWVVLANIHIE